MNKDTKVTRRVSKDAEETRRVSKDESLIASVNSAVCWFTSTVPFGSHIPSTISLTTRSDVSTVQRAEEQSV